MDNYTPSQICELLSITRDRLHYLIRRGVITPRLVRRRYEFNEEHLEALRSYLATVRNSIVAVLLLEIQSPYTELTAEQLLTTPHVKWTAAVFGPASVIVFVNVPERYEELAWTVRAIQASAHVLHTETYPLIPGQFYESQQNPPHRNLACTFLHVEEAGLLPYAFNELSQVDGVYRCGGTFGAWDLWAEIRYENENHLKTIVMDKIQGIKGVRRTSTLVAITDMFYEIDHS